MYCTMRYKLCIKSVSGQSSYTFHPPLSLNNVLSKASTQRVIHCSPNQLFNFDNREKLWLNLCVCVSVLHQTSAYNYNISGFEKPYCAFNLAAFWYTGTRKSSTCYLGDIPKPTGLRERV